MSDLRLPIKIPSCEQEVELDAWFYRPSSPAPYPLVVAGPGLSALKDAGMAAFGERWSQDAGYASLIFDYRGFGESGGQPRNLATIEKQLQDYKSVIEYARLHPETFRSDKIVVMGSAFSGFHVADLVVHQPGLAGGMAHCPLLDGYATLMADSVKFRLLFWAMIDTLKGKLGLYPTFIKAIGQPGELAILTSPSSHPGFTAMFSQGNTPFSDAPNVLAPRVVFDIMAARPGLELKNAKCPLFIIMPEEDDLIPRRVTENIVKEASGKVELCTTPGGHFDVMQGGKVVPFLMHEVQSV